MTNEYAKADVMERGLTLVPFPAETGSYLYVLIRICRTNIYVSLSSLGSGPKSS